jgi:hypothetical protein
MTSEATLLC